jgi:hypothetical protein
MSVATAATLHTTYCAKDAADSDVKIADYGAHDRMHAG